MAPTVVDVKTIATAGGTTWLLNAIRQTFDPTNAQAKIESFAKKEGFTHACVYSKGTEVVASFSLKAPENAFLVGENFRKYVAKANGQKNAVCIEQYSDDQFMLVAIVGGEIAFDKLCTKVALLRDVTSLLNGKIMRDKASRLTEEQSQYKSSPFSLFCYGISKDDYSEIVEDLFVSLNYLCEIDDSRQYISETSIFVAMENEPAYKCEKVRVALTHIRSENGSDRKAFIKYGFMAALVAAILFTFFKEEEVKEVKVNPYESYYSSVKSKYVSAYPRLASDYNLLVLAEKEIANWAIVSMTLDKGFTSYKVSPTRNEAKVAELRDFADKNGLQFDGDGTGYSLLKMSESFSVFGKDYRRIYSVDDVHQYLDDAFVTAIPSTQLSFTKDVPNGQVPSMVWVVRELTLNITAMPLEDMLTIGSILIDKNGNPLPVTLGGDETSGTVIGNLNLDPKTRSITGTIAISVFGKRN